MADNTETKVTPVRLLEGARVLVQCTVNENKAEGAILKDAPYKVQVRPDGGERYIQRNLVYPFPAGLIADPFTGKPAVEMKPAELAKAIEDWSKQIELLQAANGSVITKIGENDVPGTVPVGKLIPTPAEIFLKGFKLEIQGPVNSEMRKEQLVVKGQRATITKAAKSISSIG